MGRSPDVHHITPVKRFIPSDDHNREDAHYLENVISRSDHPDLFEDDPDLFTLDDERQLRVNPEFTSGHPFLRETVVARADEAVSLPPEVTIAPEYLAERN